MLAAIWEGWSVQDDLLVVGFDLETGREVHVAEQPPEYWRQRGYGGTRQLVCFYCFHGFEAPAGTRVPLLTEGAWAERCVPFRAPLWTSSRGGHHRDCLHITTKPHAGPVGA